FDDVIDDLSDPDFSSKIFKAAMRGDSDPPAIDEMEIISKKADSLIFACQSALNTLKDKPGFQKGNAWDEWVRNLSGFVERNKLPSGAAQEDSNKCPFANFMLKLQELCVPEKYRCGGQSPGAMAKAITRARARSAKSRQLSRS